MRTSVRLGKVGYLMKTCWKLFLQTEWLLVNIQLVLLGMISLIRLLQMSPPILILKIVIHTLPIIIINHLGVHFILGLKPSPPSLNQSNLCLITLHNLHHNQCHPFLSQKVVAAVGRRNKKLKHFG
ncbi:hypothetical protein GIB67_028676 [Kingdonia uniflora]|uniref:Uncharacterized protein n=1 Tax=Kingdonia uniflora TaxID=39325 RepID=A0A7J7MTW6_9MAGN|nr:hypothetical protein GIB67_028676 [Kingdonia uniflora]